jgi:hypothetical protein
MENIGIFGCFQRFEPPQTVASAPARRGRNTLTKIDVCRFWLRPISSMVDFGLAF